MNWADSSDDEDEAFFAPQNNPPVPDTESEEEPEPEPEPIRPKKEFVMPENPPFTAFIGNLAFSVKEGDELGRKISELVKTRFGKEITVTASRVALDRRENNKHKGFGYVEVETVDDLKVVLELNDGLSNIAGRAIHLDVAQPSNKNNNRRESSNSMRSQHSFGSSGDVVDGSKFQGGRYNNNNKGSFRRQNSDNNSGAPAQRPSLKLQPRSREKTRDSSASASNIFGGGKAREGGTNWDNNNRRSSSNNSINNNNKDEKGNNNERRTSSRGGGRGGGSGRGGRGGGRGNSNSNNKKPPSRQSSTASRGSVKGENKKEEQQQRKPPPAAVVTEAAPPTKKVVNKFAALGFSDSDDE